MKLNKRLIYGLAAIFLFVLFFGGICDRNEWQDHMGINDPILGGFGGGGEAVNWFGEWTMYEWWEQDENGDELEAEEHEGYIIYNKNGTCEFMIFDDGPFEATYEFMVQVTHTFGDGWWDGPWYVSIDWDDGVLTWFFPFEDDPDGEGEGYRFEAAEENSDLWFGEWTMTDWWYQNADGEIEESEDHEGYIIYNNDGTCEFMIFDDGPFEATYDFELKVAHTFGDDWWDGPWFVPLLDDEELWWLITWDGSANGEGEGYRFQKAE